MLGSSRAGKTSFLRRWKLGTFEPTSYSTISADYYSSLIQIPLKKDSIGFKESSEVGKEGERGNQSVMGNGESTSSRDGGKDSRINHPQHKIDDIQGFGEEGTSKESVGHLKSISSSKRKKKSKKTSKRRGKKLSLEKYVTSRSKNFQCDYVKPSYVSLQMWYEAIVTLI